MSRKLLTFKTVMVIAPGYTVRNSRIFKLIVLRSSIGPLAFNIGLRYIAETDNSVDFLCIGVAYDPIENISRIAGTVKSIVFNEELSVTDNRKGIRVL